MACGRADSIAYPGAGEGYAPPTYDAGAAVWRDRSGCVIEQLFQHVPALAPLYTSFEAHFDSMPTVGAMERAGALPVAIVAAYLLLSFGGRRLMASRKPFALTGPLIAWNCLLAAFSAAGFVRTAPHLLHTLATRGVYESVRGWEGGGERGGDNTAESPASTRESSHLLTAFPSR
jgi:hypothetical protein